jgi:DNA modification methylase
VKPVALVADAILDCSKRGGIILDAFAGSGTTLLAAERTARHGYGIELDPRYCDVILRRFSEIGLEAVHVETGRVFSDLTAEQGAVGASAVTAGSDGHPEVGHERA